MFNWEYIITKEVYTLFVWNINIGASYKFTAFILANKKLGKYDQTWIKFDEIWFERNNQNRQLICYSSASYGEEPLRDLQLVRVRKGFRGQ